MEIAVHQRIKMLFMGASEQTQRKGIDPMNTTLSLFYVNMCVYVGKKSSILYEYACVCVCVAYMCGKIHSLLTCCQNV